MYVSRRMIIAYEREGGGAARPSPKEERRKGVAMDIALFTKPDAKRGGKHSTPRKQTGMTPFLLVVDLYRNHSLFVLRLGMYV